MVKISNCPACDTPTAGNVDCVDKKTDIPRIRCCTCGLIFFESFDFPETTYDLKYNAYFRRPGDIRKAGIMAAKIAELAGTPKKGQLLLEIGPGNGLTAFLLKVMEYNIDIIETDEESAEIFETNLAIKSHLGHFEDLDYLPFYDFIYAGHVLEHVKDPVKFLSNARRCLKPEGKLFVDTPYAYYGKVHKENWKHYRTRQPYEHICIFDITAINQAAKRSGLIVDNIEVLPDYQNLQAIFSKREKHGPDQDESDRD